MSWLTDFAGKAEGFLNQIDQSAATVLHKTNTTRSSTPSKPYSLHGDSSTGADVTRPGTSTGQTDYSPKREHK